MPLLLTAYLPTWLLFLTVKRNLKCLKFIVSKCCLLQNYLTISHIKIYDVSEANTFLQPQRFQLFSMIKLISYEVFAEFCPYTFKAVCCRFAQNGSIKKPLQQTTFGRIRMRTIILLSTVQKFCESNICILFPLTLSLIQTNSFLKTQ